MNNAPLILKYRPEDLGTFIGNETAINALNRVLTNEATRPHSYLFTGPSGIGKTTLARIVARQLNADIDEQDAATNNGVDAMRALVDISQYMSFAGSGRKLLILDECHALSRAAWQSILKMLEEPPSHLFLALCTTELSKVPETVQTRCFHTLLRPITPTEMEDFLTAICGLEGWEVAKDVFQLVIQAATGQPRKALTILQSVYDAPSREEAKRIVALTEASDPMIELFQHLIAGKSSWRVVRDLIKRIDGDSFEDASLIAGRYISGALLNEEHSERANKIWQLLDALVFPSNTWDKRTAFIAAVGRMMWGGN